MFLLVPAYPGCPGSKAVKRSLLLLSAGILCGAEMKLKAEWENGVSVTLQPALPALAVVILIFC